MKEEDDLPDDDEEESDSGSVDGSGSGSVPASPAEYGVVGKTSSSSSTLNFKMSEAIQNTKY
jgi:hypothetical protein